MNWATRWMGWGMALPERLDLDGRLTRLQEIPVLAPPGESRPPGDMMAWTVRRDCSFGGWAACAFSAIVVVSRAYVARRPCADDSLTLR